jgi:hypothetical protein
MFGVDIGALLDDLARVPPLPDNCLGVVYAVVHYGA